MLGPLAAALRAPPWKYLYWENGDEALYALDSDPREMRKLDAETREMLHALGYGDLQ